jgi:hypothetical protein
VRRPAPAPLLMGYVSGRASVPTEHLMTMRAELTAFAAHEGYALADIFVEPCEQPATALQALIDSATRRHVRAVAVSALSDLGTHEITQHVTRERLEMAGLRVLVLVGGE